MPSNHLILCHPLLLLPSIFPSIRIFWNESALRIRWPKYWSFSFNINPSNEHSGLISFRMDCLDLLAVQGTLKNLLQHHSSKASILWLSAFFIIQLSHPYMTTGKAISLTRWTFVGKVMCLLFNMLSRLVIREGNGTPLQYSCLENPMDGGAWWTAIYGVTQSQTRLTRLSSSSSMLVITFLPRSKWSCSVDLLPKSKRLLISWLQSPSAVILEPRKIKSATVSTVSPSICHEVMGQDTMILVFWMLNFKPTFLLSSFTFIKRLFRSSSLSAIRVQNWQLYWSMSTPAASWWLVVSALRVCPTLGLLTLTDFSSPVDGLYGREHSCVSFSS